MVRKVKLRQSIIMNIFVYIRDYRFPETPYFLFLNVALK